MFFFAVVTFWEKDLDPNILLNLFRNDFFKILCLVCFAVTRQIEEIKGRIRGHATKFPTYPPSRLKPDRA